MTLPNLNLAGELPEGIHTATIDEVIAQFGSGTPQRIIVIPFLIDRLSLTKNAFVVAQFIAPLTFLNSA